MIFQMPQAQTVPASVRQVIERVRDRLETIGGFEQPTSRNKLGAMFEACFLNTLTTTLRPQPDGTVFVVTGDIPAMWLRDSTAQVRPYLIPARHDEALADMLVGVSKRQIEFVLLDPYANAFNESPNARGHQTDRTAMSPWVWERKYEVDSLSSVLELAYRIWLETGRVDHLNDRFARAARSILEVWALEQRHEHSAYRFERPDPPLPTDTLTHQGRGTPVGFTSMTWSGFRPSDDACTFGFLVPANMQAVVVLGHLERMAAEVLRDDLLRFEAGALRRAIHDGIETHARVQHPHFGEIYAYEVDGLGRANLMDDANVPSLLSAPYLGYCAKDDPTYQRTRAFILSSHNPSFFSGQAAQGIGSPHTPGPNIWPISLCMQGLTSDDESERLGLLETLIRTDAGTGLMHESFHQDDPTVFTREWFAWANSLFAEFVLDICGERLRV